MEAVSAPQPFYAASAVHTLNSMQAVDCCRGGNHFVVAQHGHMLAEVWLGLMLLWVACLPMCVAGAHADVGGQPARRAVEVLGLGSYTDQELFCIYVEFLLLCYIDPG